jgi:hypothetical protein
LIASRLQRRLTVIRNTSSVKTAGSTQPLYRMLNDLGRQVLDAICGAHEVAWREQSKV